MVANGLFALAGVTVGVLLTAGVEFLLVRRREQAAAKQAARLVHSELLECVSTVGGAATEDVPFPTDSEDRLPSRAWEEYGPALADALGGEAWMQVHIAYASIDQVNRAAALNLRSWRRRRDPGIRNLDWLNEVTSDIIKGHERDTPDRRTS